MNPQYVAGRLSCGQLSEALESQVRSMPCCGYLSRLSFAILRSDCTQAIVTSEPGQSVAFATGGSVELDRSKRCPKASNCLPCSQSLQALPPVAEQLKKSSSWSTPSRSASSLSTPASTSNRTSGRALASVPPLLAFRGASKVFENFCKFLRRNLVITRFPQLGNHGRSRASGLQKKQRSPFLPSQKFSKTFSKLFEEIWIGGRFGGMPC